MSWIPQLLERLPALGHRNWILVADSAYPAQVGAMEVLPTGRDHLVVVRTVLEELRKTRHVRPVVYLDAELEYLTEDLAPGWTATHRDLHTALAEFNPQPVPHMDLITRLGAVAQEFKVVVLKTTGRVPYSSVFLELDCGYWSPEQEAELRRRIPAGERAA